MGEGSSNSSRACMRFAVGLMKDGGGKTTSSNGESGSGSGCAEAGGALPFMLDAVVSRAGADFLLENSRSSLSNPLAMVGGGEMGVVSGVFVRNLYCQLHSILAQLAGAVHTCRANLRGSAAHTGAEDYVAVGSVVARGLRPYKRLMISLFDRQWALSRRSDLDAPTQHPTNTRGEVGGKGKRAPALARTCLWSSWPRASSSERLTGIVCVFSRLASGRDTAGGGARLRKISERRCKGHWEAHE